MEVPIEVNRSQKSGLSEDFSLNHLKYRMVGPGFLLRGVIYSLHKWPKINGFAWGGYNPTY